MSLQSIQRVYEYVLHHQNHDDMKDQIIDIVRNLKLIYKLFCKKNNKKLILSKNDENDEILKAIEELSDFIFLRDDVKEQQYITMYNSLQSIYKLRMVELKESPNKKSCNLVSLLIQCFSKN